MLYLNSCAGVESFLVFCSCDAVLLEELADCLQAFRRFGEVRGVEGRVKRKLEHFMVLVVFFLEFNVGISKEGRDFVDKSAWAFSSVRDFVQGLFCLFFYLRIVLRFKR